MNAFKKECLIYWTFIKSFFACQHLPSSLTVDELIERLEDEEDGADFQHWNCACTCECGEKKEQVFALCMYLGDPQTRYKVRGKEQTDSSPRRMGEWEKQS